MQQRYVKTKLLYFLFLWNHVSHAELLIVGPGRLMVGHRP